MGKKTYHCGNSLASYCYEPYVALLRIVNSFNELYFSLLKAKTGLHHRNWTINYNVALLNIILL